MLPPFAVPKSVGKFCSTNHKKPQNCLERIPPRQSSGGGMVRKGGYELCSIRSIRCSRQALNDPLIEQSTHFPLRMLNLLAMTPPPTANQSNLRFCFEALSSTSPSTGTDQPHAPLLSGSTITTSLSDDRPAVRRWAHLFCRNKVQTVWGRHRCALGVGYVPELASPPSTGGPRLFSGAGAGMQAGTRSQGLVVARLPRCSLPRLWSRLALTFQYDQPNTELQQHL